MPERSSLRAGQVTTPRWTTANAWQTCWSRPRPLLGSDELSVPPCPCGQAAREDETGGGSAISPIPGERRAPPRRSTAAGSMCASDVTWPTWTGWSSRRQRVPEAPTGEGRWCPVAVVCLPGSATPGRKMLFRVAVGVRLLPEQCPFEPALMGAARCWHRSCRRARRGGRPWPGLKRVGRG